MKPKSLLTHCPNCNKALEMVDLNGVQYCTNGLCEERKNHSYGSTTDIIEMSQKISGDWLRKGLICRLCADKYQSNTR